MRRLIPSIKNLIQLWAKGDSGYSITDKFEEWNSLEKYDRPELRRETFTINIRISAEEDIPLYTLFVTIPRGVDSIDANTYYNRNAERK